MNTVSEYYYFFMDSPIIRPYCDTDKTSRHIPCEEHVFLLAVSTVPFSGSNRRKQQTYIQFTPQSCRNVQQPHLSHCTYWGRGFGCGWIFIPGHLLSLSVVIARKSVSTHFDGFARFQRPWYVEVASGTYTPLANAWTVGRFLFKHNI
jgi:hypothetical protein